jgi:multiple sugar transport system substrate-binding protein
MSRRQLLRILSGLGGLALATACSQQPAPAAQAPPKAPVAPAAQSQPAQPAAQAPAQAAGGKVTITQWFNLSGAQAEHATKMADKFNVSQDKVEVKTVVVPQTEIATKLSTVLAAGDPPEIVHAGSAPLNDFVISGGHTEALDQWDPKIGTYDWLPAVKEFLTRDGKLMGYPANTGVIGFIYNKDLYQRAGLDPEKPPATLEELSAVAEKIGKLGDGTYGHYVGLGPTTWTADHIFIAYLWDFGGDIVSPDGKTVIFNSAEGQKALEYYVDLAKKQAFPLKKIDNLVMGNDFEAGNVGSITLYPVWTQRAQKTQHKSGTGRFPGDGKLPIGFGTALVMQKAKNKEHAWPFIQWLMQPENHLEWVMGFGNLPARLSYREQPAWQKYLAEQNPLAAPYAKAQEQAAVQYSGPAANEIWSALAKAIEVAVYGQKPVIQALDDAARDAQTALDRAAA